MPALGTGRKPAHVKPRPKKKGYTLPKTRVPEAAKPKPKPRPKVKPPARQQVKQAKAQERSYGSQGRAVERQANEQRSTSQARQREKEYASQGRAVDKRATEQRREQRIRYLRKTRPKGKELITRELEGRGVLAGALKRLGDKAAPTVVKAATAPLGPEQQRRLSNVPKAEKLLERGAKDLINFPAQAIPSVYVPVAGAVEAAKGDSSRLKKLAKDIDEGDPLYNLGAAAVEAAGGDSKSAKKRLKQAGEAAYEHPGFAALEAVGVKGATGRTTSRGLRGGGRVVRKAGQATGSKRVEAAGEKIRKAGSTERAPRRVPGTAIVEERSYSRDSFTKAGQIVQEKSDRRATKRLRTQAQRAESHGHTDEAQALREKAARRDPDRVSEQEIKRRVDERMQVNEDTRRRHRAQATKQARKVVKRAKREKGALSVVAQRIARADKDDLRAYVRELASEFDGLSPSGKRANKQLRRRLQEVIDDPRADMARLEAAAREYAEVVGPLQGRLVKRKLLAEGQADKAARIPFAVRRLGARHDDSPRLSDTGMRKFVTKEERRLADKALSRAVKAERRERSGLREAVASARVSVARNKTSPALRSAERELRASQAELGRTRRSEHAQARKVAVRRTKAEAARIRTERSFLRSDREYKAIEGQLREANAEKRQLREAVREAEGKGKQGPVASLAAVSERSRRLAADLEARAEFLRSEPLTRTIKRGPNKGQRTLAPRARVLRAQRREIAPEATKTKPAEAVSRAKTRVADAERAVALERRRMRGVAPAQHDRLLAAIATHDEAKADLARAREVAALAKAEHVEAKKAGAGKKDKIRPGLVDEHGRPLSGELLRRIMADMDEPDPAFVTQAPSQRGARNFNIRSERVVGVESKRRTGEATRRGTFDADPDTLVENAARMQGLVDATDGFRAAMKEFGQRDNDGKLLKYRTRDQAAQAARNALYDENGDPVPGVHVLRPVRINPFAGSRAQLESLLEEVDSLDFDQAAAIVENLTDAVKGKDGAGPWALIPEAAADRIAEHLSVQGGSGGLKTLQLANQAFRRTVLSTSPTWFAGNIIEGLGRAALAHAGPRSYATGRKTLKRLREIDPAMADEALSRLVGGGHFSSADRAHIRRGAEQFRGTRLAPLANALGKFWRTPGPKQAAELWHAYTEFAFRTVNGRIESNIQTAMLGAGLRKSPLMNQRVLKLSAKAIDEAARGLTKTETQVRFGREIDIMYGKYAKRSPGERKVIAAYTPFLSWWVNAVYFVTRTLPRDHPAATALITSMEQATEGWRKDHGLDLFMDKAVPMFLQGSIPIGTDGKFRASRFTPFGAFSDPGSTAAGQVLPLWQGPLMALRGLTWHGQEMRVKGEDGKQRAANPIEQSIAAAASFAGATIPIYSTVKRVGEQGPSALNPFKIARPPKPEKKLTVAKPGAGTGQRRSSRSSDGSFFGGGSSSSGPSSGGGFFDSEPSSRSGGGGGFFD